MNGVYVGLLVLFLLGEAAGVGIVHEVTFEGRLQWLSLPPTWLVRTC